MDSGTGESGTERWVLKSDIIFVLLLIFFVPAKKLHFTL
jgi:hypothetical protein